MTRREESHQTPGCAFANANQSAVSTHYCVGTLLTHGQLLVHQTPTSHSQSAT